jgi:leader peptidase (prepilin peptidase)/N-methyltransferase
MRPRNVAAVGAALVLGIGGIAVAGWRLWGQWALVPFAAIAVVGAALALIDLREHRLPNRIVLPAIAASVVLLLGTAMADGGPTTWLGALIGGGALFGIYLVLAFASPRGMGMGDVKLSALIGLYSGYLGLSTWLAAALIGFVIGGLVAVIAMIARRADRRSLLPFGPSMVAGLWVAVALSG